MPPQVPTPTKKMGHNPALIIGAFIGLLILTFVLLGAKKSMQPEGQLPPGETKQTITKETVVMKTVDLTQAKTGAEKLPAGFPASIPVETKDVLVSDTKTYTDRSSPVVVYTINYKTSKSVTEKYKEYLDYMTKNGYAFSAEGGKDEKNHSLSGTKGSNSLTVVSSPSGKETIVKLSYTVVK